MGCHILLQGMFTTRIESASLALQTISLLLSHLEAPLSMVSDSIFKQASGKKPLAVMPAQNDSTLAFYFQSPFSKLLMLLTPQTALLLYLVNIPQHALTLPEVGLRLAVG